MTGNLLRRSILSLIAAGLVLAACNNTTTNDPGPTTAFAVLRLTSTGAVDTSFAGGRGIALTDFDTGLFDFALAVAVQPDNKIIAGGSTGLAGQGVIALARYNTDGSPDAGFGTAGTGGLVRTPTPAGWTSAFASAIAVQPDSKIVVAALAFNSGTTGIVVLRYNTNGTLDTTFNTTGIAPIATIGPGFATDTCALALQGTNIIVAGATSDGKIVLYRYDMNGAPDTAFGTDPGGGKTTTPIGVGVQAVSPALAFQSTGSIIVATGNGADQVILRYSATGILDTAFGTNGIVTTNAGGTDFANAVAVQQVAGVPALSDKIVVAGHANVNFTLGTSDVSLVRYNADGTLDTTFNPAGPTPGTVITDLGGFDNVFSVALQGTNIIVAGATSDGNIVLYRYDMSGALDPAFGTGGKTTTPIGVGV
ncbi:MAG TPA: hypothetical protein VFP39_05420, partial [Gemmatimonadales bacterium]|nr:hypothetical protein [Gemmatimonadales bacterium]